MAAEGRILCEHLRVIARSHSVAGRTIYDWRHYLAVIQRKPGALRNGAPFAEMPDAFRRLQGHLLKHPGGDREMVEILALVLQHDEQAVLCAVELALDGGVPHQDPRPQHPAPADRREAIERAHHQLPRRRSSCVRSRGPMSSATMRSAGRRCAMRHDPASAAIIVMLRGLKMYGMSQAVGDLVEQGAPAFEAAIPLLAQLLKAEMAEREVRSVAYQIQGRPLSGLQGPDRISTLPPARSTKPWFEPCTAATSSTAPTTSS